MKNDITNQYKGFINTPNLWKRDIVFDISQFEIDTNYFEISNPKKFDEIRLGKRVEQFFNFQVENSSSYQLIASNIQINNNKLTIGELDLIISENNQPIHIEIVYKFYLYDPNIKTNNELEKYQCGYGFYVSFTKIENLKDYELYIPDKLNWLVIPNINVKWLSFEEGKLKIEKFIQNKRSPMIWIKSLNSNFQKCFITYW